MTPEQKKDLLIEWSLYTPQQQSLIRQEFTNNSGDMNDEDRWLEFLKKKLEIEDYWKKIGLL